VTLFEGHARFAGPHELVIDDATRITADRIVVATGATPVIPPVIAGSGVPFHTSDTIMRIDELPARMVIVGGGYVAAEFAHVFSSLGVGIALINRAPALLANFDPAISGRFTALASQRWDVRLSATLTGVRRRGDEVAVLLEDGATVTGDLLLVAAGRRPDTGDLGLDLAGRRPYVEAVQAYADTAYGWALQDTSGICKLYADPATGKLLGTHILGYQASLLIQPLVQAASSGQHVAELARGQYWIHPALTEVVENALLKLSRDPAMPSAGTWPAPW
jgi:pyruvate/2-oxoglutarate dehydrogenase complex dihydrolipoamide dehydrogenase (E3) component